MAIMILGSDKNVIAIILKSWEIPNTKVIFFTSRT